MPSIDCDMNPTAIGNDPERAGRTGLAYLIISIFFFIGTLWRFSRFADEENRKVPEFTQKK